MSFKGVALLRNIVIKRGSKQWIWESLEKVLAKNPKIAVHTVKWHQRIGCCLKKGVPNILITPVPVSNLTKEQSSRTHRWLSKCQKYIKRHPDLVVIGIDENSADMIVRFSDVDQDAFLKLISAFSDSQDSSNRFHLLTQKDLQSVINEECDSQDGGKRQRSIERAQSGSCTKNRDALAWVDLKIYSYLSELNGPGSHNKSPAAEKIQSLLATDYQQSSSEEIARIADILEQRVFGEDLESITDNPFLRICHTFCLSRTEAEILLLVMAPDLDGRFAKIYGYLNDDLSQRHITCSGIAQILFPAGCEAWEVEKLIQPKTTLGCFGLVEYDKSSSFPLSDRGLNVPIDIIQFLLTEIGVRQKYHDAVTLVAPCNEQNTDSSSTIELKERLSAWLAGEKTPRELVHVEGGSSALIWFETAIKELDQNLIIVKENFFNDSLDLQEKFSPEKHNKVLMPVRISRLYGATLVFSVSSQNSDLADNIFTQAQGAFELVDNIAFHSSYPLPAVQGMCVVDILRNSLNTRERTALWLDRAAIHSVGLDASLARKLANINRFEEVEMDAVLSVFSGQSPNLAELMSASKKVLHQAVPSVVQPVNTVFDWSDIVLPEDTLEKIKNIPCHVTHSSTVMEEWDYARRMPYGHGVTALFAGRSGTGKTMSAQIIAKELDINLYQVDLSKVVSKYIGETEKNLDQVFDAAEKSNAVLLFNEADALFGKRTEVKDSHDRHANIEVAYLLQRMENYSGLVILTTNLRQNMDKAFMRRLRFVIDFPDPGVLEREQIWRKVFPQNAPLADDINFALLARRIELSGGNIQQIAIKAAFSAVKDGSSITMKHIAEATSDELQKLGMGDAQRTLSGLAA